MKYILNCCIKLVFSFITQERLTSGNGTHFSLGNSVFLVSVMLILLHILSLINHWSYIFSPLYRCRPTRGIVSSCLTRFLDHTQPRTAVGRTPLAEWSARRIDLYLTTHNTHNRETSKPRWGSTPQSQQASGRRPTPRGHWDRQRGLITSAICTSCKGCLIISS